MLPRCLLLPVGGPLAIELFFFVLPHTLFHPESLNLPEWLVVAHYNRSDIRTDAVAMSESSDLVANPQFTGLLGVFELAFSQ